MVHYIFALLLLTTPVAARAQESAVAASTFVNSLSLWVAVVVGIIASLLVFADAKRIGGGVLGKVYYYFAIGMLLIVLGFLAVVVPPWADMFTIMRVHDGMFILGYLIIAIGARKIIVAYDKPTKPVVKENAESLDQVV